MSIINARPCRSKYEKKIGLYIIIRKNHVFPLGGGGKFLTNEVLLYKGFNIYDNFQYIFYFFTTTNN